MEISKQLMLRSTPTQWKLCLRVAYVPDAAPEETVLASYARRPIGMLAMYAGVSSLQKLLEGSIAPDLLIQTNKDGLSELRALGLV